jgi:hypothetical protein
MAEHVKWEAVSHQQSAFSPDAVWTKCKNLEIQGKE